MNYEKLIVDILSIACEIYLTLLFYNVVWNKRVSFNKSFILSVLIWYLISLYTITFFQDNYLFSLVVVLMKIWLSFYYVSSILSKLLYSSISVSFTVLTEIIFGLSFSLITGMSVREMHSNSFVYFIGAVSGKLMILVIIRLLQIKKNRNTHIKNKVAIAILFSPIYSLAFSFVIFIIAYDTPNNFIRLLCQISTILMIASNIFLFYIIDKQTEAELISQKFEFIQQQLKTQVDHYNELYDSQNEIRKIKHDISGNIIAISGLISDNKIDDAKRYISNIFEEISEKSIFAETKIATIDAVIDAEIKKAKKQDITIDYRIRLNRDLLIDQMDLAALMTNALDNAIEAVSKISYGKRLIMLSMNLFEDNDYMSISVENTTQDAIDVKKMESKKIDKKNHGFGLKQISNVAIKYDGNVSYEYETTSKMLKLCILLKNIKH